MNIRRPNMTPHKTPMPVQPADERVKNGHEVELGYTREQAMAEAERCMNCPERYCAENCPANTAIPDFISEIRAGNFDPAYEIIADTNPLAGIAGRVCPCERQCESHCTRGIKNEPVAIGRLERFVCDQRRTHEDDRRSSKEEKVAVVGSGPAGLACGLTLAKAGIQVDILEKAERIGGVMAWGIPSFVLPDNLLRELIDELKSYGVGFKTGVELGRDVSLSELRGKHDAVFLAVGASKPADLHAKRIDGVMQAADYLAAEKPQADQVTVLGGGSTAIDAARAALRTGAAHVRLVYRRTEAEMPATQAEIALAKEEGVELVGLTGITGYIAKDGKLTGVECERMEFAAGDYPGGRRNVSPTGERTVLETDLAILALGFVNEPVTGVGLDSQNRILVDESYRTTVDGIFAGGDAVTGPSTLMKAAAAGRDAAAEIIDSLAAK